MAFVVVKAQEKWYFEVVTIRSTIMKKSTFADVLDAAGSLQGSLACSAGYNLRIVFSFAIHEGKEAVLLETIGTHEEVY
jgi:mRNA-degrading endonuclease YafQ of YafQ-DinJ toxin-antitoxin module